METLLYEYNPWWEDNVVFDDFIPRLRYHELLYHYSRQKRIVFLTGLRRVGKTTLMKLLITELIKNGVDPRNILYVSIDDYLLAQKNLFEIIDEYKKIHKRASDEEAYLFFDEITWQKNYQQQLKNVYDKSNMKIFATSSSSSFLRDRNAFLTGRAVTIEVQPLDFEEYLLFKGVALKKRDAVLEEAYFKDFIHEGGLPENVLHPQREYLMGLLDNIIQKDITAFHGLKNHQIVRDFFTLLMERSGKQFSINKIANILKLSPDTARRYLNYFVETYLVHLLPRWGKTNEHLLSPKKIYACDLGIKYLFVGERDLGSYFENYCYLKLKTKKDLYYLFVNGMEIDFITGDKKLLEVKYNGEMTGKQKELFDSFEADERVIIDSVNALHRLDTF